MLQSENFGKRLALKLRRRQLFIKRSMFKGKEIKHAPDRKEVKNEKVKI